MIAWHQVAGLAALGARVTLVCGSCERTIPGVHRVVETMRFAGMPIPYRLLGDDRSFRFHDRAVARMLQKQPGEFDVVHGWPLGSAETLLAAKAAGVASFLERPNTHTKLAYAAVAEEHERLGLSVPRRDTHSHNPARLAREEEEYALADRLLCPSAFVARTFADSGFPEGRIARHQYGYDPSVFDSTRHRRAGEQFTVLFAGRCEPRKGLHYALQAWHESGAARHGRFIICGEYSSGYRRFLVPLLGHPSIEERGFVSDVQSRMREADVLVLPSIEEGSALVTYEARGAGCVVLASDASGALGADGTDILVHRARDVARLSQQFTELSADVDRLETIRRCSLRGTAKLTWAHAAQVLHDRYVEAVVDRDSSWTADAAAAAAAVASSSAVIGEER